MDELKEFFNAMDLDKLLIALTDILNESGSNPIRKECDEFLKTKEKVQRDPLNCIKALTKLREGLIPLKEEFEKPSVLGYSWNADFQLEDYLFVILGQLLSSLKSLNNDKDFELLIQTVIYGLTNMKFSNYEREECDCIGKELKNYFNIKKVTNIYYLRIKAGIDRGIRLIRRLSTDIYNEYQDTVIQ